MLCCYKQLLLKSLFALFFLINAVTISAQVRLVLGEDSFIVLHDGDEITPVHLVLDNETPNAITELGAGGNIVSENQFNIFSWKIGSSTADDYTLPFTTSSGVKIPLSFNVTSSGIGGDFIHFSTYGTPQDNAPYPTGVSNLTIHGVTNNYDNVVDRFWNIDALSYTTRPDLLLNFGYSPDEQTGEIINGSTEMFAKRYENPTNEWGLPSSSPGVDNLSDQVEGVVVEGEELWPFWTLVICTPPTVSINSEDQELCVGESATLSPTTGGTWSSTDEDVATITDEGVVTAVGDGTVEFIFTDNATGCSSEPIDGRITVIARPTITIAPGDDEICVGESVNLLPNTGGVWSSSDETVATITNDGEVTGVGAGTADMVFTDGVTGCSNVAIDGRITVIARPTITIAPEDEELCIDETATLSPTTGGTWSSADEDVATITNDGVVTAVGEGTVELIFTDDVTGCSNEGQGDEITVHPLPVVAIDPEDEELCVGESATLSPTTGGTWSSSDEDVATITNAGVVTAVGEGTVELFFVNDASGCSGESGSVEITVHLLPVVTIAPEDDEICVGESVNLLPNTGGVWSSSDATVATITNDGEVTGVGAGTVDMVFTDDVTGCFNEAGSIEITVHPLPVVTIDPEDEELCVGETIVLSPTSGGVWSTWDNSVATITNQGELTGMQEGMVEVTFENEVTGCVGTLESGSITIKPLPEANATITPSEVCVGDDAQLIASHVPDATYEWTGPNGFTSSAENHTITAVDMTDAGDYALVLTLNGCVSEAPSVATLTVLEEPVIEGLLEEMEVCEGQELTLSVDAVVGTTYEWTGPNGFEEEGSIVVIEDVDMDDEGVYGVVATTASGCSNLTPFSVDVTVLRAPVVDITPSSQGVCLGEDFSITAEEVVDGGYEWTGPNGFTSTEQTIEITEATASNEGVYELEVFDGTCYSIVPLTALVEVYELPFADFAEGVESEGVYCDYETPNGRRVTLVGEPEWELTYLLDGEEYTITSAESTIDLGTDPGTYTLVGVSDNRCTQALNASSTIVIHPSPEVPSLGIVNDSLMFCIGDVSEVMVVDINDTLTYYWYESTNPSVIYEEGVVMEPISDVGVYEYTLQSVSSDECYSEEYTFYVSIEACDIIIPEAFTPNGDGYNDVFFIENLEAYPNTKVIIYNRWGAELYVSENYANDWDGKSENNFNVGGDIVPEGTYYYLIELGGLEHQKNKGKVYKGWVYIKP